MSRACLTVVLGKCSSLKTPSDGVCCSLACLLQDIVSPVLLGQEHLPGLVGSSRPLLFVGNHQKMGLYDVSGTSRHSCNDCSHHLLPMHICTFVSLLYRLLPCPTRDAARS